jgi:hypothetical protein
MKRSIRVMVGLGCLMLILACGCRKADETSPGEEVSRPPLPPAPTAEVTAPAPAEAPAAEAVETAPSEMSPDQELIKGVLSEWKAGVQAKDIDKVMAVHSEKFESSEATGKEEQRDTLTGYIEAGYLDDAEVKLESAEIKVEDTKASVTGCELVSVMGPLEVEFELQKEDGAWLITGFEYY